MKKIFLRAFCCLLLILPMGFALAADDVLLQEDFDGAESSRNTLFAEMQHIDMSTGADFTDVNIITANPGRGESGNALHWTRKTSGLYRVSTPTCVSPTGAFSVSFWVHSQNENAYQWEFQIEAGKKKPLLTLQNSQKMNNPGNLAWLTADGGRVTLRPVAKKWRQLRLDVDLRAKTCDVYYDDMDVPVAVGLQLLSQRVEAHTPFRAVFTGISSAGEAAVGLDDFLVRAWTPSAREPTPEGDLALSAQSGTAELTATVSSATGRLTGLKRDGINLVSASNDLYTLQAADGGSWHWESNDRVVAASGDESKRTFRCTNPGLPNLTILKTYSFDADGNLLKRVEFSSASTEGFLTHRARFAMDEDFVRSSNPGGFSPGLGGSDPRTGQSLDASPYRIKTDQSLGINVSRNRVNDVAVLNNHFGVTESVLRTGEGWDVRIVSDYLTPAKPVSGEVAYRTFCGDLVAFAELAAQSPIQRELFNVSRPEWTQALVCDAMYAATPEAYEIAKALAPLPVTSTIWFLAPPWGNWWAMSDPPKSAHHNTSAIADEIRSMAANAMISAYTNMTFDELSDIYSKHRSFGVTDKNGDLIGSGWLSDTLGAPSYPLQIMNPDARSYWIAMHADRMAWKPPGWKLDFFYMDGPGWGGEEHDWALKDVAQAYDWASYAGDLKQTLKASNPNVVFFANGMLPHSDIGYIEAPDSWWETLNGQQGNWPELSRIFLTWKLCEDPGYTTILLFDRGKNQPSISTYTIAYGWCGQSQSVAHKPWLLAALEYRGLRLVGEGLPRPWWREATPPETEAAAVRKGKNVLVQSIRHAPGSAEIALQIDPEKLGLEPGGTYLMRELQMNSPAADPVPTKAFSQTKISKLTISSDPIDLKVGTTKALLTSVLISEAWCIVERIGDHPCETGLPENYGISVTLENRESGLYQININEKWAANGATIFFPWAEAVNTTAVGSTSVATSVDGVTGIRVVLPSAGTFSATVQME
jgi:hypothetical protein